MDGLSDADGVSPFFTQGDRACKIACHPARSEKAIIETARLVIPHTAGGHRPETSHTKRMHRSIAQNVRCAPRRKRRGEMLRHDRCTSKKETTKSLPRACALEELLPLRPPDSFLRTQKKQRSISLCERFEQEPMTRLPLYPHDRRLISNQTRQTGEVLSGRPPRDKKDVHDLQRREPLSRHDVSQVFHFPYITPCIPWSPPPPHPPSHLPNKQKQRLCDKKNVRKSTYLPCANCSQRPQSCTRLLPSPLPKKIRQPARRPGTKKKKKNSKS